MCSPMGETDCSKLTYMIDSVFEGRLILQLYLWSFQGYDGFYVVENIYVKCTNESDLWINFFFFDFWNCCYPV